MIFTQRIQTKLLFVNSRDTTTHEYNSTSDAIIRIQNNDNIVNQIPTCTLPSASKSYSLNLSTRRFCHVIHILNRLLTNMLNYIE